MKQTTICVIMILLSCACSYHTQNNNKALELSNTDIINIIKNFPHLIRTDNAKIIGTDEMLDMVKSIDYIKLDSSEPIGVIDKMIVTKDKIYILDCYTAQQIFVFDKTGNLLFRIKNKGRGPKEYLSVADMQVDTIRNEILVNDALARSYLYYSTDDGTFLRREKGIANCYLARIDSLSINLQIPGQDFNDDENWAILVSDKDSVLYKGFAPTPLQDNNFAVNSFTYDYDGTLLYTPVYSDTVYQFTTASVVKPEYVICQKKSVWRRYDEKLSPQEVNDLIKENNYTRYGGKFLATKSHASFEIGHKWNKYIVAKPYFWDKKTDAVYVWDTTQGADTSLVIRDIIQQPIAVYGDTFFGTCSPQIPEEYRKNLSPKIKNLLECSKESDNPIVVAYTLK
ncbi:6-bladed beta-propeller [Alistipes onderdonkii]|uniref:6-bladed beta-propeller n=1 Tax=Alistipes onderdonkii TaxID=328813 RepID=UPI0036F36C07